TPAERAAATVLYRSLQWAQAQVQAGERDAHRLRDGVHAHIATEPLARIDYVEVVDAETLQPVERVERPTLIAVAAFFGKARLIDNCIVQP
ncbi:MAG: pantoate--beta-alanine ligase, partial [Fimbriimonadales bacterium]|nr:pantoate--beta-alanine ligase [Fimbriimonadales bacterium]